MVFIIDKSGSMEGLESDFIGGFNAMLKEYQVQGRTTFNCWSVLWENHVLGKQ